MKMKCIQLGSPIFNWRFNCFQWLDTIFNASVCCFSSTNTIENCSLVWYIERTIFLLNVSIFYYNRLLKWHAETTIIWYIRWGDLSTCFVLWVHYHTKHLRGNHAQWKLLQRTLVLIFRFTHKIFIVQCKKTEVD